MHLLYDVAGGGNGNGQPLYGCAADSVTCFHVVPLQDDELCESAGASCPADLNARVCCQHAPSMSRSTKLYASLLTTSAYTKLKFTMATPDIAFLAYTMMHALNPC
jgi:hypothetical protein